MPQHVLRPVHPCHTVPPVGQGDGVVAGAAPKVENRPCAPPGKATKRLLYHVALGLIVFLLIEEIVLIRIAAIEWTILRIGFAHGRRFHASTFRRASVTWSM